LVLALTVEARGEPVARPLAVFVMAATVAVAIRSFVAASGELATAEISIVFLPVVATKPAVPVPEVGARWVEVVASVTLDAPPYTVFVSVMVAEVPTGAVDVMPYLLSPIAA
jgi:hypothetical protein